MKDLLEMAVLVLLFMFIGVTYKACHGGVNISYNNRDYHMEIK